jgi:hypothetical protein
MAPNMEQDPIPEVETALQHEALNLRLARIESDVAEIRNGIGNLVEMIRDMRGDIDLLVRSQKEQAVAQAMLG